MHVPATMTPRTETVVCSRASDRTGSRERASPGLAKTISQPLAATIFHRCTFASPQATPLTHPALPIPSIRGGLLMAPGVLQSLFELRTTAAISQERLLLWR